MRIAEVAEQYDLSADTLRYYERIGLLRPVRRNALAAGTKAIGACFVIAEPAAPRRL